MKASVIIPSYNRMPILKYCLSYLMKQTFSNFEVILIDDCSLDETRDFISKTNYQNLRYIRLEQQRGPYYARNLGIDEASGDLIILIDSDVIVFPDFVEDHVTIHKRRDDIVLQGMVKHINKIEDISLNRFYIPNALCIKTFITQNVSVRKKWFIKAGGFSNFGSTMGYKDVDMGLQFRKLGLKWVYGIRKCKAFHIDGILTPKTLDDLFEKWRKQGVSAYYFVRKWDKIGEKYAHTKRAIFFSKILSTHRWIEKENIKMMMLKSKKNLKLIWTVLKGVTRYHYRRKGIEEAKNN
jgi:glycosyltransferase involved in cell wall biosynthesis